MSVVKELIRTEADGGISFGDYELAAKAKKSDFEHRGDLYKVKTFKEITKLEKNRTVRIRIRSGNRSYRSERIRRRHDLQSRRTGGCTDHR